MSSATVTRLLELHRKKKIDCPSCGVALISYNGDTERIVEITTPRFNSKNNYAVNVLQLYHMKCKFAPKTKKLWICIKCGGRSSHTPSRLVRRHCKCNQIEYKNDINDNNEIKNSEGHNEPRGNDETIVHADTRKEITSNTSTNGILASKEKPDSGDNEWIENAEGHYEHWGNDEAILHTKPKSEIPSDIFANKCFASKDEWPSASGKFFLRENRREGDGVKGLIYNALIDRKRVSEFGGLGMDEVHHHLHITSLHHGISQLQSKNVCGVMNRVVTEANENTKAALVAQKAIFMEIVGEMFGDGSQVGAMMKAVDDKMNKYHATQERKKKINEPTDYNKIRMSYLEGPNSILKNLPMPEVDIMLGCAHIPVNQIVNHLLALRSDVLALRAGVDGDWLNESGKYKSMFLQEKHEVIKSMMVKDPTRVTNDTRVVFARLWSDGFEAFQIKAKNDFNNLQIFTLTLRATGGKITKHHMLPYALCFKKNSHCEIFMQLLAEVNEMQTPRMRYFGGDKSFHTTIVFLDMISQDYPERCASTCTAQLGLFTHRWGFTCKYDEFWTPSCGVCQLKRIERLLKGQRGELTNRVSGGTSNCKKCSDWWSHGRFGVHVNTSRYPVDPGLDTPLPTPAVEITFEMLQKSMDLLQIWYNQSKGHNMGKRDKGRLRQKTKDHLSRLGISSQLIPLLANDMEAGIDIRNSEHYYKLWGSYKSLDLTMKQFGSMLMHMCALGVEKSLISQTKIIVNRKAKSENQLWYKLTNSMNKTLNAVGGTSLDWCLTMSFSGKDAQKLATANWESDHYLAFTRLSLFHFAPLDDVKCVPDEIKEIVVSFKRVRVLWFCLMSSILGEDTVDTHRIEDLVKLFLSSCRDMWTISKMDLTGDECAEHDNIDDVNVIDGHAREPREMVQDSNVTGDKQSNGQGSKKTNPTANTSKKMRKGKGTKRKNPAENTSEQTQDKKKSMKMMHDLNVTGIKQSKGKGTKKKHPTENISEQAKHKKKRTEPFFVSGSNYLSLLNIPEMIKYFGPAREFWEGIHESYIQNIKKEIKIMRHTEQFLVTILRKALCTLVLKRLVEDNPYSQHKQYARTDMFKTYKVGQDEHPSSILEKNSVLSGIIDRQGKLLLCTKQQNKSGFVLLPITFNNDDNGYWCYNLWYSRATIGPAVEMCTSREELNKRATDSFLMLCDDAANQKDTAHYHTVICRSWKVRSQSGVLTIPVPNKEILLLQK